MTQAWPEYCPTCGAEYDGELSFCSNPFHCCRDCRWINGRAAEPCPEHRRYPGTGNRHERRAQAAKRQPWQAS